MIERPEAFNFFGPRTLVGPTLQVGDAAPDFQLTNPKLQSVTRADFAGKPLVLSVVPALDTGVCTKQTVRFNAEAAALAGQVNFVTVSADLPFTQTRWCGSNGAEQVTTLSDHRDMSFAQAYGTYLRDFRLESRAVFVIDSNGVIRHVEYVPAAGQEPDYDAVMEVVGTLI
jgi:thiol peroxidase